MPVLVLQVSNQLVAALPHLTPSFHLHVDPNYRERVSHFLTNTHSMINLNRKLTSAGVRLEDSNGRRAIRLCIPLPLAP